MYIIVFFVMNVKAGFTENALNYRRKILTNLQTALDRISVIRVKLPGIVRPVQNIVELIRRA